jgi:WD40 repeat protein
MRSEAALLVLAGALAGCGRGVSRDPFARPTGEGGGAAGGAGGSTGEGRGPTEKDGGPAGRDGGLADEDDGPLAEADGTAERADGRTPPQLSGAWTPCGTLGTGGPTRVAIARQAPVEAILFSEGQIAVQRSSDHARLSVIEAPRAEDLTLSSDGTRVAVAGPDGLAVYDTADGARIFSIEGVYDQVIFDGSGAKLLARAYPTATSPTVELRDGQLGTLVYTFGPVATDVMAMAFSADGGLVGLYQADGLTFYRAGRVGGVQSRFVFQGTPFAAALSWDATHLAVLQDKTSTASGVQLTVAMYDPVGGRMLWSIPKTIDATAGDPGIYMSSDGTYLYLASGGLLTALQADLGDLVAAPTLVLSGPEAIAASSINLVLFADASGVYASPGLASAGNVTRVPTLAGQGLTVMAASFSPDGSSLATSWYALAGKQSPRGPQVGQTVLWNLGTHDALQVVNELQASSLSFSSDGGRLLASAGGALHELPVAGGDGVTLANATWLSAYAADDRSIFVSQLHGVRLIEADGTTDANTPLPSEVYPGFGLSPDRQLVAATGPLLMHASDLALIWPDMLSQLPNTGVSVLDNWVAFSPDGQSIVVSDFTDFTGPPWNRAQAVAARFGTPYNTSTRIYNASDGAIVRYLGGGLGRRPVFSPDGAWILAGGVVRAVNGDAIVTLPLARSTAAVSAFAPDGTIAVGREDGVVQLFCPM